MKFVIILILILIVIVLSDITNECNSDDESCNSKEKTYDDLPSSWKDHMPFFDILIQYYKQFSSSFQSSAAFNVVDLGVGSGYTSLNFATKLNNSNSNVYGIDIYLNEDRFRYDIHNSLIAKQNENMLANLSILIGEWNTISRIWNYPIDILNIDGSYDYNSMKMTIDNWSKYVKRDGIILIHDIETNLTTTNNNITTALTRIHDDTLGYYKLFFTYSTGLLALTKNMDLYKRLRVMYGNSVDSIEFLPTFWKGNSPFANWIVYQKNMTYGVIVDLGVDWGYSTMHWANALQTYADANSKVYGIDLFNVNGSAKYQDVMGLISKYNVSNIEIIKDDFGTRAYFWNKPIDILHIDGFHDYHLVKSDFDNWVPHLKLDGIIVFHDLSEVSELEGLKGTLHFFNSLPGPRLLLAASDVNNGCEIPPCSRLGIYTEDRNTYHAIFLRYNGRIIYDDFVSKIKPSSGIGHRLFVEWLVNHQNYKNNNVIVQLGVDHGYSLFSWAVVLRGSTSKVYGIDPYNGNEGEDAKEHTGYSTYNNVMQIMENNTITNAEVIVGDSASISKTWDKTIDILHIECFHTYETIKAEYDHWLRYLRSNGTILFHYKQNEKNGADAFFKELEENKTGYTLFFEKIGLGLFVEKKDVAEYILSMFQSQK